MNAKYKKTWGGELPTNYLHFAMFGLLCAKVVRTEDAGIWITFEPSEYYTEAVHKVNKELFKGFFDDEDVIEIRERLKKESAVMCGGVPNLPTSIPEVAKKRGRPPKDKPATPSAVAITPVAVAAVVSDELEMPKIDF